MAAFVLVIVEHKERLMVSLQKQLPLSNQRKTIHHTISVNLMKYNICLCLQGGDSLRYIPYLMGGDLKMDISPFHLPHNFIQILDTHLYTM